MSERLKSYEHALVHAQMRRFTLSRYSAGHPTVEPQTMQRLGTIVEVCTAEISRSTENYRKAFKLQRTGEVAGRFSLS